MTALFGAAWFGAVALVCGGAALAAEPSPRAVRSWRIAVIVALFAGAGAFMLEVRELADGGVLDVKTVTTLLRHTRYGRVWAIEHAALVVVLASLFTTRGVLRRALALSASAVALAAVPFASHSAGGESQGLTIAVHALHLVAFALWLGGLATLAILATSALPDGTAVASTRDFSRRAPFFVGLIVATGILLARVHVARWPALLGTPYGIALLAKLGAFAVAMLLAARLRWRLLPALAPGERASAADLRRSLVAETACGALAVLAAAWLADTVPAAHDAVTWWLPFRFSIRATWSLPWVPERVGGGFALAVCALAVGAGLWRRGARRRGVAILATGTIAALVLALPAISVPAFPGTYEKPEVPYHAISVANGRSLYRDHCVRCHGEAGRGDGPVAREQPKPPANLTEPHTADHTAGDMFWWLTHGIEPSGMPPFADVLSPEERWDLVNYLRAFAAGYQARILGPRISAGKPWLAAVDFNYRLMTGERGLLRDFRGKSVVLLVLFTPGSSDARLARLRELLPEIRRTRGEVLAVPLAATAGAAPPAPDPLPTIVGGAAEIVDTYLLLRRTFSDPGNDRDDDRPPHVELLIDRFGYVRARWRPDVDPAGWNDDRLLLEQIGLLSIEPRILASPDDHVH